MLASAELRDNHINMLIRNAEYFMIGRCVVDAQRILNVLSETGRTFGVFI